MTASKLTVLLCAVLSTACARIPPRPAAPVISTRAPIDGLQLGERPGAAWPDRQWWKRYRDPTLDELVGMSVASAPSLGVAFARFNSARESVRETAAAVGARIDFQADVNRQRLSDNGLIPPRFLGFSWYNQSDLGFEASYTFDWWGKQRLAVESAVDAAHAAEAEGRASELALISAVVDSYFGWQVDQARLDIARQRASDAQRAQSIAAARLRAEIESPDALSNARAAAGAAREQVAILEGSLRLRRVAIAALVGRPVAALPQFTAKPLPAISVELPDNVGIDLLARRADIAASRWRVEAAQKTIASARAEYYPDVSIKALAGLSSIKLSKLLEIGSGVPSITAAVHLPIFDAGRLSARVGATQAQLRSAIADYEDTLVNATKELSSELSTRQQVLAQRAQRALAVDAAERIRSGAKARVRAGLTDLRPQLDADQNLLAQRDALLQLDGAALSADVGLQRALGGGYLTEPIAARTDPAITHLSPMNTP